MIKWACLRRRPVPIIEEPSAQDLADAEPDTVLPLASSPGTGVSSLLPNGPSPTATIRTPRAKYRTAQEISPPRSSTCSLAALLEQPASSDHIAVTICHVPAVISVAGRSTLAASGAASRAPGRV